MDIIDSEGRLFGYVNIIDTAVIVVLLLISLSGILLLTSGGTPTDSATDDSTTARYVTVSFADKPADLAGLVEPGETVDLSESQAGPLRVVDVYRTPAGNGRVNVVALFASNDSTNDATLRVGEKHTFISNEYQIKGIVSNSTENATALPTATTNVTVEANISARTARVIDVGDQYRVAGETVAQITDLAVIPTRNDDDRVRMALALSTLRSSGNSHFGGRALRINSSVPFKTSEYMLDTTVGGFGRQSLEYEPETVNATVRVSNVSPAVVESIPANAVERTHGQVYAQVKNKQVRPATVVLTTDSGEIVERQHPINKTVTLSVELTARRTKSGLRFHGRPLQNGRTATFDFGSVTVRGTITGV